MASCRSFSLLVGLIIREDDRRSVADLLQMQEKGPFQEGLHRRRSTTYRG